MAMQELDQHEFPQFPAPQLPDKAKEFIDSELEKQTQYVETISDQKLREAYQHINELLREIGAPKYTIDHFRDLHSYRFEENSVAWLISDRDLISKLINKDIYFVQDLQKELSSENFILEEGKGNSPEDILSIESALQRREEYLKQKSHSVLR